MTGAVCGQIQGNRLPILIAIYLALLLFGIAYNWLTAWSEKTGFIRGYTAFFVAGGVLVTLAAMAVISPAFALLTAMAFVFSGTPMIVGSMVRHKRNEIQELVQAIEEARHGDEDEEMAPEL
jgi:hypothetical protein